MEGLSQSQRYIGEWLGQSYELFVEELARGHWVVSTKCEHETGPHADGHHWPSCQEAVQAGNVRCRASIESTLSRKEDAAHIAKTWSPGRRG